MTRNEPRVQFEYVTVEADHTARVYRVSARTTAGVGVIVQFAGPPFADYWQVVGAIAVTDNARTSDVNDIVASLMIRVMDEVMERSTD